MNAVSSAFCLARFFAEARRRAWVFFERAGVRFFARAVPVRLVAVEVRRVVAFRRRAVRLFVRDAAVVLFERDFLVLDFLPARDFVGCFLAMSPLPGGRIEIGTITI
jgi:hypothetical protein